MALVKLRQVKKTYQLGSTRVPALRGVDLEVQPREFTALVGPTRSGKTTLLNIIGCVDRVDAGSYRLDGEELGGQAVNDLAEVRNRKIGSVFQAFNLIPVLSVVENIEFPCLIRGDDKAALRARALETACAVGLEDALHIKANDLSGGQRQRVAIARALITEPQLVLADEPTAGLEAVDRDSILELLLDLNQARGVTFIFSTHDPQVMQHAKRVVRIANGVLADVPRHAVAQAAH